MSEALLQPPAASPAPRISVLVPSYNEAGFIGPCLDSVLEPFVLANTEVLVIDGMSPDGTRDIVRQYSRRYPVIRLLDNPGRLQSHGLNIGLAEARGSIIVRLDAHSTYPPGYVERSVNLLQRTDATLVGGVMEPVGTGLFTESVACAMMHPLGIGGSKFHHGTYSGYVDTVYLATTRKEVFSHVGEYDPKAHPAEDAELNCRILKNNGRIFLDASLRVQYGPRSSWKRLARQFFGYGRGRCYVILKHQRVLSLGRLAPPLLVLAMVASLGAAFWNPMALVVPTLYLLSELGAGLFLSWGKDRWIARGVVQGGVLATMHLSYGLGFLLKFLRLIR